MGSRAKRCLFGAPDVDLLERERVRLENLEIERAGKLYGVDLLALMVEPDAENNPPDAQTPSPAGNSNL